MSDTMKDPEVPKPSFGSSRRNYLIWVAEVQKYLDTNKLRETIIRDSKCTDEQKKIALDYLWRNLGEDFQNMYIIERDPHFIWNSLNVHFDKMREAELPEAMYDWDRLRYEDFDSVIKYNSALQRLAAQLKACGREVTEECLIEKTLSTFPASERVLRDMYRKQNHQTYLELVSELLVAEKYDEAVMRNYNAKPAQAAGSKRQRGPFRRSD